MKSRLDPTAHGWMIEPATRSVMRALSTDGGEARFVGGAVRNALLGEAVGDVDIATPLTPDEVMARLTRARLGAVLTGIAHGTVTAVSDGKPFEITTLRRDVETDGRHAVIAFTQDWREDAARRDFTINALYASEDGTIHDYFGGLDDLAARRVRFVGDAGMRIREDFLRILRLFRFHAWYGKGGIDATALAASVAEKSGLKQLSGERVQKELLRLLEAKDPVPVLRIMNATEIISEILPRNLFLSPLLHVVQIDDALCLAPDPIFRLARMLASAPEVQNVIGTLKLSNKDRERLLDLWGTDIDVAPEFSEDEARKQLYRLGAQRFKDRIKMRWSGERHETHESQWRALFALADAWKKPEFPLDGRDVMAVGIDEGPKIGVLLRDIEQRWVDSNFAPGRPELLQWLAEAARKSRG